MQNVEVSWHHAARPGVPAAEAWVYEKGLPRTRRDPLVEQLGNRLLVATDLSDRSRPVEDRALELAEAAGAHLVVLAVLPSQATGDGSAERRLRARIRLARRRGISVEGRIVAGEPAESILRVAAASGADAIVIGRDQWRGWAGEVCGHVTLHACCPVLLTSVG